MNKSSQVARSASSRAHHVVDHLASSLASKTRFWWLLLISGVIWIAIGFAIPRFAYETVATLAKLVGVVCLVAAANEALVSAMSSKGGRVGRGLLAVVFVALGVIVFVGVKATVVVLAAVMSVILVFWGAIGVLGSLAAHRERGWWVLSIASLTELAIGLSVASSLTAPLMTLLTWAAVGTVVHGVGEIALAFLVRRTGVHVNANS